MSARKSKKSLRKPAAKPARKGRASSKRPARSPAKASKKKASTTARPARAAKKAPPKAAKKVAKVAKAAQKKAQAQKQKLEKQKKLLAQKAKEQAQRDKARAKAELEKQREKERAAREKAKALAEKEREKQRVAKEKAKALAEKERERQRVLKEKEKARLEKEREKQRLLKEKEKAREQQEKERAKAAALKAREEERERKKKEAADERARKIQERDAAREAARKQKEEERARRDAEREAYRKAKEAERERLRAEREAARRALEGKVARASKRLAKDGSSRGGASNRVYRPDAIPNQSGTTRRTTDAVFRPLGVRPIVVSPLSSEELAHADLSAPPGNPDHVRPTPPPPVPLSVEERYQSITERLGRADAAFQREYRENFDMSWIYHDSALEGVVYTFQELKAAVDPSVPIVPDSSLQPACEEIRRHRAAIELVRDLAERKRVPINVDMVKKLYVTLHPEEGDVKTVKYRKDIPQHRLYFHEYVPPDKIAYRVRQIVDWLNGPEPKKMKNPLRVAARVHYDLVRVFPFQTDSGKVSRLLMNLILMRSGYPPAIIHSTERQKYYEALKGQLPIIINMTLDAISNALASIEKHLDEHETRSKSGGAASTATPSAPGTPAAAQAAGPEVSDVPDEPDAARDTDDEDDSDDLAATADNSDTSDTSDTAEPADDADDADAPDSSDTPEASE